MSTDSHCKVKMRRSIIVLMLCLAFYSATHPGTLAMDVRIMISRAEAPLRTAVTVSATGFGIREALTISVDLTSDNSYPDKRYHDWLNSNQCNLRNPAFSGA